MCLGTQAVSRSVNHTVMLCCYVWGSHDAGVREYTALLWPFHQSEWRNRRHCELTRLEARSTSVCRELVCVQRLTSITHEIYEITVVIADLQSITTRLSSHFRNLTVGSYLATWSLIHIAYECSLLDIFRLEKLFHNSSLSYFTVNILLSCGLSVLRRKVMKKLMHD